ncbi:MAG TPA: UPF0182 family protein [Candidatus Deferrimicrobium sp.]|nr:UPF0182 family protein [Candidatus Deferrimicrobium sp.]
MKTNFNIKGNTALKIIIGVAVAVVFILIFFMSAIISLVLNQQFYDTRLGLNWWNFFTLNNSAILWCPLITILVLVAVVTVLNPTTSSTLSLLHNGMRRYTPPSRMKCLVWNYVVVAGIGGLVMGWVIGFLFEAGFGIYVANYANLDYSFFPTLIKALGYPLNPGAMDINVLFTFSYILRPFILLVVGAIIVKLAIDMLNAFAFRHGHGTSPAKVAGSVSLIISLFFFIIWLFLPNGAYDLVDAKFSLAVVFGFFAGLVIGVILYVVGMVNPSSFRKESYYKPLIVLSLIVLFILPVFFCINAGIKSLYKDANWPTWVWDSKVSTQIATTRTAAGLENFTELTTQQLLVNQSLSGTTDEDIIPHIRTYDMQASRVSMENQIGTLWEELADSDIIYMQNSEFWVAPRKIRSTDYYGFDWVQWHLIYTHSRGFIALNPVTGTLIPQNQYQSIFGVPYNYSIYFGENPDNGYTILNNTNFNEIEGITYQGIPDVSLSGFLNWWYIEDWGFKTGKETDFLIKRNIFDRVSGILLPHMITGDDPYLVFDTANNKMYYSIDIILDFPSFSGYIQSDIVRWLGVVLIDTQLGTMGFYQYNNTYADLPYSFLNIYLEKYDWQEMPDWLIPQLKYPEILAEYQLSVDYTYHVTDKDTWRNGEDFFERPYNTDMHYIMYDVGYGLAYVGASIVEFKEATVGNLVGFYIVENGKVPDYLGRFSFYRNGTIGQTQMIGLTAATSAYQQKDAQFLQLLMNKRFGNYLIYPLAGSLYFVIPVYEITGSNIETLKRVALVNAFNPSQIGIGNSTIEAYLALNITTQVPQGVLSLNIMKAPAIANAGQWADLEILINNGYTDQSFNLSLEIATQYELFNVSHAGSDVTPVLSGGWYNYSIANFSLIPRQYSGYIPQVRGYLHPAETFNSFNYYVNLYFDNGTLYQQNKRSIYIYI